MPTATASGSIVDTNGNGHVSFSELVRAHHEWDAGGAHAADADIERRYRELLATFEAGAGEIVDAYWCRRVASAVALTRRERQLRSLVRRRRRKLEYRLHRVSDWVTEDTHEIADLLHDCDILAIKAANGLESVPRAVVMQWLLLVESHLLGFIERAGEDPARPQGGEAVRRRRARRAGADRGLLLPGRREARDDALRRGDARPRHGLPVRERSSARPSSSRSSARSTSSRRRCVSSTPLRQQEGSAP